MPLPAALRLMLLAATLWPCLAVAEAGEPTRDEALAELEARTRVWRAANPESLPHWLTPEELGRLDEIGRTFTQTPPPELAPREIAEFERMSAVLVRYPFGIPISLIAAMSQETPVLTLVSSTSQENSVRSQYLAGGVNLATCSFLHASTNSYWTRDYGPWFVQTGGEIAVVDFPYNRPRPLDDDIPWRVGAHLGLDVYGMNLIQTGGNWMTDGYGVAASSDLVVEENPGLSEAQIDQLVLDYLGVETYHTLPDPNNTYIDHIDCWGKFLAVDKVLIREVPASHTQYDELEATAAFFAGAVCGWGTPYEVFRVWTPNNQPYTNSLILNGQVFVPMMNSSWDDEALAVYQSAMPGYEVLGFAGNAGTPWESTDAIHCRAKGLADSGLLRLAHVPAPALVEPWQPTELQASITACSGQALIDDSLRCWFRIDGGSWTALQLAADGEHWRVLLPPLEPGQELDYCLQAADAGGRFEQHPFTGRFDPHQVRALAGDLAAPTIQILVSGGQVVLDWEPVPGAASYRVEVSTAGDQPFQPLVEVAVPGWTEPAAGDKRLYRVRAVAAQPQADAVSRSPVFWDIR